MSRTLLVATSSAGLVLGGALSANASDRDDGHYGDHHHDRSWAKGWLTVCQTVRDDYRDHDYRDPRHDDGRDDRGGWDENKNKSGFDDRNSTIDNRYRYGDHDRRDLDGRYLVRDSRGKTYWITLEGRRDCSTIKVNRGWAKVSVVHRPDDTRLTSASSVWVKVHKDRRAVVNFSYETQRDHHHHYADSRR